MAQNGQGALGLLKLLQIGAALIYLGVLVALFWKFGGEACEFFVFCSWAIATLIACLLPDRTPPHPFLPSEQKPITYQEK